ncbi:MAG: TAXI family TRAP transporter solute-binding subunit [Pseudorhodoplanes sp.]
MERPTLRGLWPAILIATAIAAAAPALAQTYGFATLPPGTLNHTTASAVAKVLKEKANINMLVQPTAGDQVIVPMVSRGEVEIGITNILEFANYYEGGKNPDLRVIGSVHPLRTAFWVRKDAPMQSISDLKGKRVTAGYSAMRTIDLVSRAILATGGLTEKDIQPIMVPNVVRSADDFMSGASDMFFFAFGGPKVREADATVGGIRVLEINEAGMDAARKVTPYGYLTDAAPGPIFTGVSKPMKVYAFDNLLFTNAKVPDEFIYKFIETLENNKADLVAVQPVLREFSAAALYKKYDVPYHPGALKYFKDKGIEARVLQ